MFIGRKDPCPCGSGKKYKKCCLDKDQHTQSTGVPQDYMGLPGAPDGRLRRRIMDFVVEWDPGKEHLDQAYFKWEGHKELPKSFDQQSLVALMDYFIHDYIGGKESKPVLQLFYERKATHIPEDELAILEAWLDNRRAFYEVQSVRPDEGLDLKELFSGQEYQIFDKSLSHQAHKWDIIWLRLIRQGDKWLVTGTGISVRRRLRDALKEKMEEIFKNFLSTHPQASWEQFLKGSSGQINQMIPKLYKENTPEILTGTGELMTPAEAVFEVMDFNEIRSQLDKMKDFRYIGKSEEEPKGLRYDWLRKGPSARIFPGHYTRGGMEFQSSTISMIGHRKESIVLGILTLTETELYLSCLSQERVDRLTALFERRLPGLVQFKITKRKPLAELMEKKQEKSTPSSGIPPEVEEALVRPALEDYYQRWVDISVPALNGLTPRQAVRSRKYRPALLELLKDFENHEEIARGSGHPVYGVNRIREKLGLGSRKSPRK